MTIYEMLDQTTVMLRKGERVTHESRPGIDVVHIFDMPPAEEAEYHSEKWALIDVHFIIVAVWKEEAEKLRDEFTAYCLKDYPEPERLKAGPSYIEIGAALGSQDAALQFLALGSCLDLWAIVSPASFGIEGAKADEMAGAGFVMSSGFRPK